MHLKDAAMSADGRQPHILVINDTQEILDLMQELLEDEGYRVTTSLALLDIAKVRRSPLTSSSRTCSSKGPRSWAGSS